MSDVEAQIQVQAMASEKGYITNDKAVELVAENQALRSSVSKLKTVSWMLVAVAGLLTVSTVSSSIVAITTSQATTVDEVGHLLSTESGKPVATIGEGQVFALDFNNVNPETGKAYACMTIEDIADMWKSTMNGVSTNAMLIRHDAETDQETETGMALTFDGATHDEIGSCIMSSTGKKICANFASDLCQEMGEPPLDRHGLFRRLTQRRLVPFCIKYPWHRDCKNGGGTSAPVGLES